MYYFEISYCRGLFTVLFVCLCNGLLLPFPGRIFLNDASSICFKSSSWNLTSLLSMRPIISSKILSAVKGFCMSLLMYSFIWSYYGLRGMLWIGRREQWFPGLWCICKVFAFFRLLRFRFTICWKCIGFSFCFWFGGWENILILHKIVEVSHWRGDSFCERSSIENLMRGCIFICCESREIILV